MGLEEVLKKYGIPITEELLEDLKKAIIIYDNEPLEDRRANFIKDLTPFVETYGKDMVNDFYHYYSAVKVGGRKMLFEKQKSWKLEARLANWKRMSEKFKIVNMLKVKK